MLKVLNLYAGIGGNRKLWQDVEVTAVELDPKIAAIYQDYFPDDKVIIADAHQYLLEHYKDFDFIWSSPPCQSHSRTNYFIEGRKNVLSRYPDMKLWQEILFLKQFFKGKYCIENVISYYDVFIEPHTIGRHYFWANFRLGMFDQIKDDIGTMISGHPNRANRKPQTELNAVNNKLGLYILNCARNIITKQNIEQQYLFE